MKYRGQVRNGVVVLENGRALAEGTLVEVEPVKCAAESPRPGSAAAILRHAGIWDEHSKEVDRLLAELHDMKQAELTRQGHEQRDKAL